MTIADRLREVWRRSWTENRPVRAAVAVAASALGLATALLSAALGHCSAFGGRCPDPPQPWWQDDVFGGVFGGMALATFAIVVAVRPGRRGLLVAVGAALAAGLPVAIIVARAVHTGP